MVVDQSEEEAVVTSPPPQGSRSSQDVSVVLNAHDSGSVSQMRGTGPAIPQLVNDEQPYSLSKSELAKLQEQDGVFGSISFYIQCHRRPTRRERAGESCGVMKLLRHCPSSPSRMACCTK